jgi:hypothetical protein
MVEEESRLMVEEESRLLKLLPKNIWEIHPFGKDDITIVINIPVHVNWFHRLMTKLIFGWYWKKLD